MPVNNFWAVTLYDTQTRSQLQTSNPFPTLGSQSKGLKENADGSYDVYFGPRPPQGEESNWLETIPGKNWFTILRMYGPLEPWIKKTWRPGEIELVEQAAARERCAEAECNRWHGRDDGRRSRRRNPDRYRGPIRNPGLSLVPQRGFCVFVGMCRLKSGTDWAPSCFRSFGRELTLRWEWTSR